MTDRINSSSDVELQAARDAHAEAERKYRLLAEHSTDVIVLLRNGIVEWISPAVTEQLGWQRADWQGRPIHDFFHPEDLGVYEPLHDAAERGERVSYRVRMQTADGGSLWVEVRTAPYISSAGTQDGLVKSLRVIEREVSLVESLERRVRANHLLGLVHSHGPAGGEDRRKPGTLSAVLFCHVDDYAGQLAALGRTGTEHLMAGLVDRIADRQRSADLVTRCGDDQVLVLLEQVHELRDALNDAEDLRFAAEQPVEVDGHPVHATLSIGVTLTRSGESVEDLLARADEAMVRAMRIGRNQVVSVME